MMLAPTRGVDNIRDEVFEQVLNGKFLWQRVDKVPIASS
jgi:hypothetical protein